MLLSAYPVLSQKLGRERPGCVSDNLVNVAAVADGIVALVFVHDGEALKLVCEVITAHCGGVGKALNTTLLITLG